MARITVEVDGVIYSKELINNRLIHSFGEDINTINRMIATHEDLVACGIFDEEFNYGRN